MNNKTEAFELAMMIFESLSKRKKRRIAKAINNNQWDYTHEWENCIKQAIVMKNWYNLTFEKYGEEIDE